MYSNSSIVSCGLTNLQIKPCNDRFQTFFFNPISHLKISKHKDECFFPGNRSLQKAQRDNKSKMDFIVCSGDQSGDLIPFNSFPENWKGWLLGLLATVILPLLTNKWGPLLKLKSEVDTAEQTAEEIAETVEKVAEEVEKVAEDVADALPEGGKLRNAATFVENVAKVTEKDADLAEELIDKVEKVENDVVSLIESNATKVASDQKI